MNIKKSLLMGFIAAAVSVGNVAGASPVDDNSNAKSVYKIADSVEVVYSGKDTVDYIDHNPTSYSKREIGGHVVEGWIENGVAYSKVDNGEARAYKIAGDLEKKYVVDDNVEFIDHNPTSYSKREIGGHMVEGWIENGVAYSKVDNGEARAYKIAGDLEKKYVADDNVEFIDHNPTSYSEREIGGHTAAGWIKGAVVYNK